MPIVTTYTIKKGDTMSEIAQRNGVSLKDLEKANPQVKNPNLIYSGNKLTIPTSSSSTQKKTSTPTPVVSSPAVKGNSVAKQTAQSVQDKYIQTVNANIKDLPQTKSAIESSSVISKFETTPIYQPTTPKAVQSMVGAGLGGLIGVVNNPVTNPSNNAVIVPQSVQTVNSVNDIVAGIQSDPVYTPQNVYSVTSPVDLSPVDNTNKTPVGAYVGSDGGFYPGGNDLIGSVMDGDTGIKKDDVVAYVSMAGLFLLLMTALGGRGKK